MDQGDQKQRRRGAVDRINTGIDTIRKAQTAIKIARTAGTAAEVVSTSEIWIPIAIVVAVILIFVIIIIGTTGGGTGSANPLPGGGPPGSGNISSCQFTRAGQKYLIKSSVLAGWINDAANAAGIPPAVLASVAMHENQDFVTNADDRDARIIANRFCIQGAVTCVFADNITTHPDVCTSAEIASGARNARAIGLMQLLDIYNPPPIDLCNIRASLSIAAQKLKDNGGITIPPQPDQIRTATERYYGSCNYDAYSYCDEVLQDYQSCQTFIAPAPPADIRQGLIDNFGITMDDFDNQHLEWVWEKLYELSNTNFTTLIRGAKIQKTDGLSLQIGCFNGGTSLFLGQYEPKDFFKFIFTHELGHVIQACRTQAQTLFFAQRIAFFLEGGISEYARDTSRCFPGWNNNYGEDYADMIAYYVNPSAGFQSGPASCGLTPNPPNPYLNNNFLLHYNVVKNVIGEL